MLGVSGPTKNRTRDLSISPMPYSYITTQQSKRSSSSSRTSMVVLAVTLVWSNQLLQDLFATGQRSSEDLESLQQQPQKQHDCHVEIAFPQFTFTFHIN